MMNHFGTKVRTSWTRSASSSALFSSSKVIFHYYIRLASIRHQPRIRNSTPLNFLEPTGGWIYDEPICVKWGFFQKKMCQHMESNIVYLNSCGHSKLNNPSLKMTLPQSQGLMSHDFLALIPVVGPLSTFSSKIDCCWGRFQFRHRTGIECFFFLFRMVAGSKTM